MKRAVIFLHGFQPKAEIVKRYVLKTDFIVCADGGVDHAFNLKLTPNIVIGDFDSLSKTSKNRISKENIPILKYPQNKDETDSELVVRYVEEQGFEDIVIFGWMGSRLDHSFSNLLLLGSLDKNINATIVEPDQVLYIIHSSLKIKGKKEGLISLIPLNRNVREISTRGLKWALKNETLFFGKTRGVSNEFISSSAEISVGSGVLLVVQSLTQYP